jgi:hypothetical protein
MSKSEIICLIFAFISAIAIGATLVDNEPWAADDDAFVARLLLVVFMGVALYGAF